MLSLQHRPQMCRVHTCHRSAASWNSHCLSFWSCIILWKYWWLYMGEDNFRRQFQRKIKFGRESRLLLWSDLSHWTAVCSSPFKPMSEDHWWWKLFYDCDHSTCGAMLQTHWNVVINKIRNKERSTEKLFQ